MSLFLLFASCRATTCNLMPVSVSKLAERLASESSVLKQQHSLPQGLTNTAIGRTFEGGSSGNRIDSTSKSPVSTTQVTNKRVRGDQISACTGDIVKLSPSTLHKGCFLLSTYTISAQSSNANLFATFKTETSIRLHVVPLQETKSRKATYSDHVTEPYIRVEKFPSPNVESVRFVVYSSILHTKPPHRV
ncbi:hypothetical protein KIN20_003710 [Parelaphostrongylus tenuis]|uniref:Uncharacterized protein n=1 Tax=Parelaphostrongylus tenuis TaxID=148309 RepID=A0AAD5QG89_PARTN|nr:hypothetical protein KIN20_003710 [Parelaphostrongylus tenuis]